MLQRLPFNATSSHLGERRRIVTFGSIECRAQNFTYTSLENEIEREIREMCLLRLKMKMIGMERGKRVTEVADEEGKRCRNVLDRTHPKFNFS